MKSIVLICAVALGVLLQSDDVAAQYNLRTVPSTPQAGSPFVVAFDGTPCEIWRLVAPGAPPSIGVQGNTVRVAADLMTILPCIADSVANTVSIPALPEGTYQLELVARALGDPGTQISAQTVSFQVGPAVNLAPLTIPATDAPVLALLALLLVLGIHASERARKVRRG